MCVQGLFNDFFSSHFRDGTNGIKQKEKALDLELEKICHF